MRRRGSLAGALLAPLLLVGAARAQDAGVAVDASAPLGPIGLDAGAAVVVEPAKPEGVVDVTSRSGRGEAQRLQRSAEAVSVIDTRRARAQTADLGEVLARTQGISLRRDGGLGSNTRFSLNGLYDDQIRFFLDGVPLDMAGYPFGVANVPVNLIERIEVYRGVVPVRFGADALGGALNLVTNRSYETHLSGSLQVGSFGTQRVTVEGRYRHQPTGLIVGGSVFFDNARNDYRVDVEIPNDLGQLAPARVRRFHDRYRAFGANLEVGVVDKRWAKRLIVQGLIAGFDKELQHNIVMTIPYGDVHGGQRVGGVNARYDVDLTSKLKLESVAAYARRRIDFVDNGEWNYNWRGERLVRRGTRGEIGTTPTDQSVWQDAGYARALLSWQVANEHALRLSLSPAYVTRTGEQKLLTDPTSRDPLTAKRDLFTFVSGLEYELAAFGERLAQIVFVKSYIYRALSDEPLPGNMSIARNVKSNDWGIGDSLRYRFSDWLFLKTSYEYATRLPRADEVFGNAMLVLPNLQLQPETSHNVNLGPRVELRRGWLGQLTLDINAFLRASDKLIVLLGNDETQSFRNVFKARGYGLENALTWLSPGRWVGLDGALTWQDIRNQASEGPFAAYKGDRIPNRPWLFASWGARARYGNLPAPEDALELFYVGRYVHEFFRGWESQGLRAFKDTVDKQVSHNLGLTYARSTRAARFSATFEISNLTDAKLFDNFGVQRPGRAYYLKLLGEI